MTLTSLTGKSLNATRGARWWCLCHSRWVTDKHHGGSINRRIALSPLPLQKHSVRTVAGCFSGKTIIINPQSRRLARVACTIRRRVRRTRTRKRGPRTQTYHRAVWSLMLNRISYARCIFIRYYAEQMAFIYENCGKPSRGRALLMQWSLLSELKREDPHNKKVGSVSCCWLNGLRWRDGKGSRQLGLMHRCIMEPSRECWASINPLWA